MWARVCARRGGSVGSHAPQRWSDVRAPAAPAATTARVRCVRVPALPCPCLALPCLASGDLMAAAGAALARPSTRTRRMPHNTHTCVRNAFQPHAGHLPAGRCRCCCGTGPSMAEADRWVITFMERGRLIIESSYICMDGSVRSSCVTVLC